MLRLGAIRTGFILGLALLLASIIYFFAANWGGMARPMKVASAGGLVVLLYGASGALSFVRGMREHHRFLSAILLLGGCIAFGASTALLGQIYNSHADSYRLFLVWAIPALLLSWTTRSAPFYVLAYALTHIGLYQYFYPSSVFVTHSESMKLFIGGLFALINLALLLLSEWRLLASAPLKLLSFAVLAISMLTMTNSFVYVHSAGWMNLVFAAALGFGFYYYFKLSLNKMYLTLCALAASAFAVLKFIELAEAFFSVMFFFYGLVFVALLLTGNVLFFRRLHSLGESREELDNEHAAEDTALAGNRAAAEGSRNDSGHMAAVVSTVVTAIGIVIGSASLIGLFMLLSTDSDDQPTWLFAAALLIIITMSSLRGLNATVRYTLLTIGYVAGSFSIVLLNEWLLSALLTLVSAAGWFRLEGRAQRAITYGLLNLNGYIMLYQLLLYEIRGHNSPYIILLLLAANGLMYIAESRFRPAEQRMRTVGHWRDVRSCSLFFALLFALILTFFGDIFPGSYALFNAVFLIGTGALLLHYIRKHDAVPAILCCLFWFVFLAYKYYDLLWSLLHKSVTFALLGMLTMAVTYWIARRNPAHVPNGETAGPTSAFFWQRRPLLLVLIVILQLGFTGYQAAASEHLLRTGTSVKLRIVPLDPRSLLQGDYVTLSYTISQLPEPVIRELEKRQPNGKVKVVLKPDDTGVYQFDRLYDGEVLAEREVMLNGRWYGGGTLQYGIETYFVPEGTGAAVEERARYAFVRVSRSGDALLERLAPEQSAG